jgi:uncharacterized protein (TIGR02231 family)
MRQWLFLSLSLVMTTLVARAEPDAPEAGKAKSATSRVTAVTVYQTSALVTREVDVPEGAGSIELVVASLPPRVVDTSLYSEGTDGIRVLATRARTRAVKEDTRDEVRKLQTQIKDLLAAAQKIQSEIKVHEQNLQMLGKLENFTAATMQHLTEKGLLSSETTIKLSTYVMDTRGEKSKDIVTLQQQLQTNAEQTQFAQRQLHELAANSTKTEHDAIIVVEKKNAPAGKVRLHYLVDAATWRPQYKLRAGKDKDPVQLEYLAAIEQNTGEDWSNINLVLSTAQPMLNAAPPDLKTLEVTVLPVGHGTQPPNAGVALKQIQEQSQSLRGKAQAAYNTNKAETGGQLINDAAALEQWRDLLAQNDDKQAELAAGGGKEGPSVTYHLATKLSIPSRNDEQVVQVARVDLAPDYFYKAVPVLTPHVYRLANLTNKSDYILLPGEATMYIGTDFVGRTALPLVAIGEQFTAGFGVDPQLQVQRRMLDKARTTQGGNQVLKYDYRILLSSYKAEPVNVQVWDRLPHAEAQAVAVTLLTHKPEISTDPLYLREERTKNMLRWDVRVDPTMSGEKALAINYEFKVELDRQMQVGTFTAK